MEQSFGVRLLLSCPKPKMFFATPCASLEPGGVAAAIDEVRKRGDSCGGVVTCVVRRCPKGLGSPVFDKLEAELAKALMSLPATKVLARHQAIHCKLEGYIVIR